MPYSIFSEYSPTYIWGTILVSIVIYAYLWLTENYGFFEAQGLFSISPDLFFGNMKDVYLKRKDVLEAAHDTYQKFGNHKYGIFYECREPILYIKDPEMIKRVAIKDFDFFQDQGLLRPEIARMQVNNLGMMNLSGENWKSLKAAVSPAFSFKSMRGMVKKIDKIGMRLVHSIHTLISSGAIDPAEVHVEPLIKPFTMDVITQVAFSVDVDAIGNPDNTFMKYGDGIFQTWRHLVVTFCPWLVKLLNISKYNPDKVAFFCNVSSKILKERDRQRKEGGDEVQNNFDVLELLIRIRNNNVMMEDEECNECASDKVEKESQLKDDVIAKTMLQFFLDGFETVSISLVMSLYFLACNQEAQDKAREEVDEVHEYCDDDNLDSQHVSLLKYVDNCFSETMRLTALDITARSCTKAWKLPDTQITIPVGMRVYFPILSIHMDPKYFPDPEKFDPDRFSQEQKSDMESGTFLPFGIGPRQCMGVALARLEAKIMIYHILRNFILKPCAKTKIPLELENDFHTRVKGGCFLEFVPRPQEELEQ